VNSDANYESSETYFTHGTLKESYLDF